MNHSEIQSLGEYRTPDLLGSRKLSYVVWRFLLAPIFRVTPDLRVLDRMRAWLLITCGAQIGKGLVIRPTVKVFFPWNLVIGDNCWIGDKVMLYCLDRIVIEHNVCISQECFLNTGSHDYTKRTFDLKIAPITIRAESWIGARSFINLGVTIGRGAVIGAMSNVVHDIPADMIAHGNPCRPQRPRNGLERPESS